MKSYVLISNGNGGIATFQKYIITNILRLKSEIFLIDKKKSATEKYFKKIRKGRIRSYYCNPISEPKRVLNYLTLISNRSKKKQTIFIFSNPLLLILYFFFIKIKFNETKIYLFLHSHILKYNFSQLLINFLSSILSPLINKIYFVSEFTKKWWLKYFFCYKLSNYKVHHNSVELPQISKSVNKGNRIGFVGRLEKEKGINIFLKIAEYMSESKFSFEVFGDGSLKKEIKKNKYINLNKWENQNKIYKKIDILFLTSPIENCPFTILEAKSYGVPTLSISAGGIKEIIKNNNDGIILESNSNYKKIKKNLMYLKNNINKFKKNCIKNRKKFNEKINYLRLIKEM